MNIIAIRHGETEGNVAHIIQSHLPGVLTKAGIEQAKATGLSLKDESFDVIFCSDLKRCVDTASYIRGYHPKTPIIYDHQLRERSQGVFDGKPYDVLPAFSFDSTKTNLAVEGGETWMDVSFRVTEFLNKIYENYPKANVLVVSHGGTLRVMRSLLTEMPLSQSIQAVIDNGVATSWNMNSKLMNKSME